MLHYIPLWQVFAIFACACWASAAEPSTDEVREFQQMKVKAEAGDVNAQYKLGGMFGKGYGVAKNDAEAVTWYRKAAIQGEPKAQFYLGWCLLNGAGVPETMRCVQVAPSYSHMFIK